MKRKTKRKPMPKKRASRVKPSDRRTAKVFSSRRTSVGEQRHDFIDRLMIASARALRLTVDPGWRDSVKFNLRLVLDHAARVEAFLLPDDAEPAPLFHA